MANYINADEMIRNLKGMKTLGYDAISLDGMIKALREDIVPDAVEVVRCRDCRHFDGDWCWCWDRPSKDGNGYCNCAARKEN